jgi:hypothetical protein
MEDKEVNEAIAEFMGFKKFTVHHMIKNYNLWVHESRVKDLSNREHVMAEFQQNQHNMIYEWDLKFTNSLDMLVPVWDKLESLCDVHSYFGVFSYIKSKGLSIQQSAAHATARAIIESNK